jgi:hypothetical protein
LVGKPRRVVVVDVCDGDERLRSGRRLTTLYTRSMLNMTLHTAWSGVSGRITDHHNDFPRIEGASSPTRRNSARVLAKSDDSGNSALCGRRLMNQHLEFVSPSMPAKEIRLILNYLLVFWLFHLDYFINARQKLSDWSESCIKR